MLLKPKKKKKKSILYSSDKELLPHAEKKDESPQHNLGQKKPTTKVYTLHESITESLKTDKVNL